MEDKEFLKLVDEGLDALPKEIRERMKNVAIVIADEPTPEQKEDNDHADDSVVFGLYEGVPQTERGLEDTPLLPDKITIFKLPILSAYSDKKDIAKCVENTVWHEIAHHFGMEEDEVEREEKRRGKVL